MNPQRTSLPALAWPWPSPPPPSHTKATPMPMPQPKHGWQHQIIELTVDDAELMHMLLDEGVNPLACRPTPEPMHGSPRMNNWN